MQIAVPKIQVPGNIHSSDLSLKQHIELLEAKKRELENIAIKHGMMTDRLLGIIEGLNIAIEQLYMI